MTGTMPYKHLDTLPLHFHSDCLQEAASLWQLPTIQRYETGIGLFKSNEKETYCSPMGNAAGMIEQECNSTKASVSISTQHREPEPSSQQAILQYCTLEIQVPCNWFQHVDCPVCCNPDSWHRAMTDKGPLAGSLIPHDNTRTRSCELVQSELTWHLVPTMGWHRGLPSLPLLSHVQFMVHKQTLLPPFSDKSRNLGKSFCRNRYSGSALLKPP